MKIIIAPDSFKESMTASEAAQAIYAGFKPIFPTATYELIPLADGAVELAIALTDLKQKATASDILLTGEGSLDSQTKLGKTPLGVLRAVRAVSPDCTVIGLADKIEAVFELHQLGFDAVFSLLESSTWTKL